MGNFLKTQNIFSDGEVSEEFYAINNIHGLSRLENMDVLQSGGLKRRPGLKKIGNISHESILVPFQISETEKYLLVIYNRTIDVYSNDTKIETLVSPWLTADLSKLQYVQRFDSIYFVHPNYNPRILTKTSNGFNVSLFKFAANTNMALYIPFKRFNDTQDITITISTSVIDNNHATFTTNVDLWDNTWVNTRLLVNGNQWIIESVQSERIATVFTNGNFSIPQSAIQDWWEAVFGDRRGWPISVLFYQNRLIFAGTKTSPSDIWMSKTAEYNNFDTGTGLDDEAIYTTLLSAQHHQICTMVGADSLQVLTSVGEWAISNSPLTPSNVDIKQHTSVGSVINKYLPPQKIEGATVFIAQSGKDIRELDLDTLNQKYNATDLCVFAKHLMNNPVSIAYNPLLHKLFVIMDDGNMAVLNKYINTNVSAWARYTTDGEFQYVTVMNNTTYVIVKRGNNKYLEKFDETCLQDADEYEFSYKISGLPIITNGHNPRKLRARKMSVRVMNTKTLFVNNHRVEMPDYIYDENNPGYTGDLTTELLGYQSDTMKPLWSISSSEQLPATILSVTIDGWYLI